MATITGTLKNPVGTGNYSGPLNFQPTSDVKTIGTSLYSGQGSTLTISGGTLSTTLAAGEYVVTMDGTTPFTVLVPSGTGTYDLLSLITSTGAVTSATETYLRASEQTLTDEQIRTVQFNSSLAGYEDVPGVPWFASRGALVVSGCSVAPASGSAFGMAAAVDAHLTVGFVNLGNQGRLTNSGVVKAVRFYVPSTLPANCSVYVDIWRKSGERWQLVGSTADLRGDITANGTVQTATLTKQIRNCQIGDYIGGHLTYTSGSWGAGFHSVATASGYSEWTGQDFRWAYSPTISDCAQWDGASLSEDTTIPIQCYMDSPSVVIAGDSRAAGFPYRALLTATQDYDPDADMASRLEKLVGFPCRNVSIEGNDSGELEARFATDVTAAHASVVVILDTYYNDIYKPITKAAAKTSITNMINAALADGSKVVVGYGYPFKDPAFAATADTNVQNFTAETWKSEIKAICETYDENDVLFIDLAVGLGVERLMRDGWNEDYDLPDNLWDLQPLYSYDGLHMKPAGAYQMARILAGGIRTWLREQSGVSTHQPIVLADAGDADLTMTRPSRSVTIQPFETTLTGNRTVTLPTAANHGDIIRVVRTGLGSYTLDVGSARTIPSATAAAVEVVWNGSAWKLSDYSPL